MSRKPYVRPLSKTGWWLTQGRYVRYMAREVTCIFIAAFSVFLIEVLYKLSQGREVWYEYVDKLNSSLTIILLAVALFFAAYHSATWFNLTPKAMPVQIGEKFVPGWAIIGAHYLAWAVVSLIVLFLAGGF